MRLSVKGKDVSTLVLIRGILEVKPESLQTVKCLVVGKLALGSLSFSEDPASVLFKWKPHVYVASSTFPIVSFTSHGLNRLLTSNPVSESRKEKDSL